MVLFQRMLRRFNVRCDSIAFEALGELVSFECTNAATERMMPARRNGVPGHEEGVFFFFFGRRGG